MHFTQTNTKMKKLLLITAFLALIVFSVAQYEEDLDDYLEDDAQALRFRGPKFARFRPPVSLPAPAPLPFPFPAAPFPPAGFDPSDYEDLTDDDIAQALFLSKLAKKVKRKASKVVDTVKDTVKTVRDDVTDVVDKVKDGFEDLEDLFRNLRVTEEEAAALFFSRIKDLVRKVKSNIPKAVVAEEEEAAVLGDYAEDMY